MPDPLNCREQTSILWRARLVVTVLGLGWLVLSARLIQLQWIEQHQFADKAEQQRELIEEIAARPGDIVDRQGRLLATTLSTRSLYLVPSSIGSPDFLASALAEPLGMTRDGLLEKIEANSRRQFLWIKRRLTE